MYVLSWPALRLLALERSGSDRPNYVPQKPKSSVLFERFLEVFSLTSSGVINTPLTVALEAIARVYHGRHLLFLYFLSESRVFSLSVFLRWQGAWSSLFSSYGIVVTEEAWAEKLTILCDVPCSSLESCHLLLA
jgi:hypothetical protein